MSETLITTLKRKRAILFDLFHTLTSLEAVGCSGQGTCDILGVSRDNWNEQLLECSRDRLVGKLTNPHQIIRRMAHAIDPAITEERIVRATEHRIEGFAQALVNVPETTLTALTTLRQAGKRLALISNADVIEAQAWERSPLAGLFDLVLFSCRVGSAKPEPEIYRLCLERLALEPEDCLFVGDGGSDELAGARACGITTVMMAGIIRRLWPQWIEARREQADFVIEELTELLA